MTFEERMEARLEANRNFDDLVIKVLGTLNGKDMITMEEVEWHNPAHDCGNEGEDYYEASAHLIDFLEGVLNSYIIKHVNNPAVTEVETRIETFHYDDSVSISTYCEGYVDYDKEEPIWDFGNTVCTFVHHPESHDISVLELLKNHMERVLTNIADEIEYTKKCMEEENEE